MPASGLVVSRHQGVTVAGFRNAAVLDALAVEAIAAELYALVDERAERRLILDFDGVELLSSQMLGVLLSLHKKAGAIRGKVVVCGLRPRVRQVFKTMNLHKVLEVARDEQRALGRFGFPAAE
jgi:anti-anti-sigma factor